MDLTKQCWYCRGTDLLKERFMGADWWKCRECHATYTKPSVIGCSDSVEEVQTLSTPLGVRIQVQKRRPDGRQVRRIARERDAKAAHR